MNFSESMRSREDGVVGINRTMASNHEIRDLINSCLPRGEDGSLDDEACDELLAELIAVPFALNGGDDYQPKVLIDFLKTLSERAVHGVVDEQLKSSSLVSRLAKLLCQGPVISAMGKMGFFS